MGYFLLQLAFIAIPALLIFAIVYYIAKQIKTNRRRNIFFLLSPIVLLVLTILSFFFWIFYPFTVYEPLGLLLFAGLALLIGFGAIIGAIAAMLIWKRKQKKGREI